MADQILQCLNKAEANTNNGKGAINKEALGTLRNLNPAPKYHGGSMTNPSNKIEPVVGVGATASPPSYDSSTDPKQKIDWNKVPSKIVEVGCKVGLTTRSLINEMEDVAKRLKGKHMKTKGQIDSKKIEKVLKKIYGDKVTAEMLESLGGMSYEELCNKLIEYHFQSSPGDQELMKKLFKISYDTYTANFKDAWDNNNENLCNYIDEDKFNKEIGPLLEKSESVQEFVNILKQILK